MRIAAFAFTAVVLATACGGAAAPAAAPSVAPSPTATPAPTVAIADSSLGKILVAAQNKMTLYTYAKDTENTSNCYDACATAWPPLVVTGDPVPAAGMVGKLAFTTRKDGAKQLTHNGKPLYFYAKDTKPGDTVGQNVGQVWFVILNP